MLWRIEGFKGKLDHIEIGIDREHTKNIAALEYRKQQLENQLRQLENARTFKKEKLKAERVFCGDMQERLKREQSTEQLQSTVALCWESISDMDQISELVFVNYVQIRKQTKRISNIYDNGYYEKDYGLISRFLYFLITSNNSFAFFYVDYKHNPFLNVS